MNGKLLVLAVALAIVATGAAGAAPAGPPAISGSSITAESMTLVFGANFDDPSLQVHVQAQAGPKAGDKPPDPVELQASLERVLAGKAEWPAPPDAKDQGWKAPESHDSNVMAIHCENVTAGYVVKILRARTAAGVSAPYVLDRPEVWGASPHQPTPGATVTVWGVNIGYALANTYGGTYPYFGLVSSTGKVVALLKGYFPAQNQHTMRVQEWRFYRSILLPADLAPGSYKLYCWNGYGDPGWSEAGHEVQVVAPAPAPKVVRLANYGAAGDGVTDDTAAIEKAMAAAAPGGGQVLIGPGRYEISHPLVVPEGVSLVGLGAESCRLEASRWKPFTGEWPAEVMTRPADYTAATYHNSGWGIDWYLTKNLDGRQPMVWIKSHSGVEGLTLDATAARTIRAIVLIGVPQPGVCVAPTVRDCRLISSHAGVYDAFPTYWETMGMMSASPTENLVVEGNLMKGSGAAWEILCAGMVGARVRGNTFTVADMHDTFVLVTMHSATRECLFEDNIFENGGRGKTGGAMGAETGYQHDLWLHNTFRQMWKDDGEILMYESGAGLWHGQAASGGASSVVAAGTPGWKPNQYVGCMVFLTGGPGIGQFRTVTGNDASSLTVDQPWRIAPDARSTFGLLHMVVTECLHLGNEFYNCTNYCGIYGAGVRNVWCNEIYQNVSGGLVLWAITGYRAMYLNLVYAEKFNAQAGITLYNRREGETKDPAELAIPKVIGNEIRWCSVRERSYISTENGQIWNDVLRDHWARKGISSPLTPVPGTESGITIMDEPPFWGGTPNDPALDALPVSTKWNLVADNQIVRCPIGIELGKAVDHTILYNNTFYETPTPVLDLAKGTENTGSFVSEGGLPVR